MSESVDQHTAALREENRALREQIALLARQFQTLQESEEQYRMIFQQAAAGFAHVLQKPVLLDTLAAVLKRLRPPA